MRARCMMVLVLSAFALCAAGPVAAEELPGRVAQPPAVSAVPAPTDPIDLNAIFGTDDQTSLDPAREVVLLCSGTYLESTCEACGLYKVKWCDVYSGGCKICGPCGNLC